MKATEILNGLSIPAQYYVGFDRREEGSAHVLGFATPMDKTKAFERRKETVDQWRDKTASPVEIENKPTSGFSFKEVVSRIMTDNKKFRVSDPRGFDLEISAANLLHLIVTSTIMNGTLVGEFVWARKGSDNWLLAVNSENYRLLKGQSSNVTRTVNCNKDDVGKLFRDVADTTLYASYGRKWAVTLYGEVTYRHQSYMGYDYLTRQNQYRMEKDHVTFNVKFYNREALYLFGMIQSKYRDEDDLWIQLIRRSGMKDLIDTGKTIDRSTIPTGETSRNWNPIRYDRIWYFDTKQEAEKYGEYLASETVEFLQTLLEGSDSRYTNMTKSKMKGLQYER